ncbi:MAG: putative nucleotidyltransferase with HDIG domain [Verrucomicrobiales bacterium]
MQTAATKIVTILQEAGHTAYFAGGCVRDQLLGIEAKDYDIATSAIPSQVLELFPKGKTVGAHFGVIIVNRRGHMFEIATFRTDGSYSDGRRPESVEFSTPEEDAQRRDFTINGLFFDPITDKLIDFVGGEADIEARQLRAIGDARSRLREDYLRLLRAIRFAARLDYEIGETTWCAIRENAPQIKTISAERIRDEFSQIITHQSRVRGFDLLVESGLMEQIMPEILDLKGCEQPPQFHPEGDVFVHTRLMLSLLPDEVSLPLALSVLLHDIGKPATYSFDTADQRIRFNGHDKVGAEMAEDILRRMKFPNLTIEAAAEIVSRHMAFMNVQKMRKSKLKRFMNGDHFKDEMELHRVDCLGSWGGLDNYDFLKAKAEEFASEPLVPPPFINGKDLIARGQRPGPRFQEILTEAQNLQLEGELQNRDEALSWLDALLATD